MKPSPPSKVREMYDSSADDYAQMMDADIESTIYRELLGRLSARIDNVAGALVDTSCGSGHMLDLYHQKVDPSRQLLGVDLSERMVEIATKKLANNADIVVGDMRRLDSIATDSVSAIISFFALHHLSAVDSKTALNEWHRILRDGGQLLIASWHGEGEIDFGGEFDIKASLIRQEDLMGWVQSAGFEILACTVAPVDGIPMDAAYLEGEKK